MKGAPRRGKTLWYIVGIVIVYVYVCVCVCLCMNIYTYYECVCTCVCVCVYVHRVDALSVVTSLPARADSRVVECRWVKAIDAPVGITAIAIQTRAPRDAFVGQ